MKLNWGTSVAIFYGAFVVIMVFMVLQASRTPVNMVMDNYYDQDLQYESFRRNRLNGLETGVLELKHEATSSQLQINFPKENEIASGTLLFYRPSDQRMDQKMDLLPDENNHITISTDKLKKGYWKVIIEWKANGKSYFREEPLIL